MEIFGLEIEEGVLAVSLVAWGVMAALVLKFWVGTWPLWQLIIMLAIFLPIMYIIINKQLGD